MSAKVIDRSTGTIVDYVDRHVDENLAMVSLAQVRDCLENRIGPYTDMRYVVSSIEQIMNQLKTDLK